MQSKSLSSNLELVFTVSGSFTQKTFTLVTLDTSSDPLVASGKIYYDITTTHLIQIYGIYIIDQNNVNIVMFDSNVNKLMMY